MKVSGCIEPVRGLDGEAATEGSLWQASLWGSWAVGPSALATTSHSLHALVCECVCTHVNVPLSEDVHHGSQHLDG